MGSSVSGGVNLKMIALLDKVTAKIEKKQIVQEAHFKRAKNHLSSITIRIPPQILGYIFDLAITRKYSMYSENHFDGPEEGSYNFLLVCHHWSQVAFSTPKLWRFWGNTFQDWNERYHLSGNTSVDLVLDMDTDEEEELCAPLQDQLRDRITQDKIRRIHLQGHNIGSILSLLTPDREDIHEKHIKSFMCSTTDDIPELQTFFARLHLPFLQCLYIGGGCNTPLWDHPPQTTCLTVLSLKISKTQFPPMHQLISVLNANPNLQDLSLGEMPSNEVKNTGVQVPLLHLKTIDLDGEFTSVFQLLKQLQIPAILDLTSLTMTELTFPDITSTLVPYMQNLFQCDLRFKEQASVTTFFNDDFAEITVTVFHESPTQEWQWPTNSGYNSPTQEQQWPVAKFNISTKELTEMSLEPIINLIKGVPLEWVKFLETEYAKGMQEELFNVMPKLEYLWLDGMVLLDGFFQPKLDGGLPGQKLLPSLKHLCLEDIILEGESKSKEHESKSEEHESESEEYELEEEEEEEEEEEWGDSEGDGDWQPLITFLEHQSSAGQLIALTVTSENKMSEEIMLRIKNLVSEFEYDHCCPEDDDGGYYWYED